MYIRETTYRTYNKSTEVYNVIFLQRKICFFAIEFEGLEVDGYLTLTQEDLIKQISNKEDIDVAIVRQVFKSAEDIIFDYLSSTTPSEEISIKLFNGICIKRKYIKGKKYSKGMFQNIDCPEHVNTKACMSKYYNGQINQRLFGE